jgi:hypothetical protein
VFDSNNRLKGFFNVENSIKSKNSIDLTTNISLWDYSSGDYLKVFIWDGIETMKPFSPVYYLEN